MFSYIGPDISSGPLPALFYFALSAEDSLHLDPYNQPVAYLSSLPMRIFSMTLPGHEGGSPPTQALDIWAAEISRGNNLIHHFASHVKSTIDHLLKQNVLDPEKLAVAGLSRGAFIAAHAAAAIPEFRYILGFAPLTQLSYAKEFQTLSHTPLVQSLSLTHLADPLSERSIRFYIGNHDTRVSTRLCFDLIDTLSQTAHQKRIRSPQIELIIGPSIGHQGHGTSKEVFHHGAQWIAEKLKAIDVV